MNMSFDSEDIVSISQLKFDLNLPATLFSNFSFKNSDVVGIMFEREIIASSVQVEGNTVIIDLNKPITLTTEDIDEESGLYEYSVDVYINAKVDDNITLGTLKDKFYGQLTNYSVTIDEINNDFETYAEDNFSMSVGQLENQAVIYTVDKDSCLANAKKLADCDFESGETITRTITIDNNSSKAASGIKVVESYDKGTLSYTGDETSYNLVGLDAETPLSSDVANNYINQYQSNVIDEQSKEYYVSIPATTQLQITDQISIDAYISEVENITLTQEFTQFNINPLVASQSLTIKPIVLELSNLEGTQIVDDGIITENEAVELSFKLKNTSSRGISRNNNVVIENSINGIIDSIEVLSVVDENWYDVSYVTGGNTSQYTIHLNKDLKAGQSIEFKLKVRFNDLKTSKPNGVISIKSYKDSPSNPDTSTSINTELNYDYVISTSSYLQLAKDQLLTKEVVKGETYAETYDQSTKTLTDMSEISGTLSSLTKYVFKYAKYITTIDSYTTLSNIDITQIKLQLKEYGLGYEGKDDEDYLAAYDYCESNNEISCRLFNLYNKVYSAEDDSKQYFNKLLMTINPELEIVTEEKVDDNGQVTDKPANVGADFNGYGECDYSQLEDEEECDKTEVGIWQRIDNQKTDIDDLNDKIDLVLDNEVVEVDEEPYKAKLSDNNTSMNSEMDKVESENNDLFNKKIEVYDENYQAVSEYLQEVIDDETYIDLVEAFDTDETARQEVTKDILNNTYELMPNTYLDGIPNKLVYSFIANPLNINDSMENEVSTEQIKSSINMVYVYIFMATTITLIVLGFIMWKMTKGV